MILQDTLASCGTTALSNAIAALGWTQLPPDAVFELTGCTEVRGTMAAGIKRAATKLQLRVGVVSDNDGLKAWYALRGRLAAGHAAVLVVDDGEHWVAAIGMLGDRVVLVDSAASVRKFVSTCDRDELLRAWRCDGERHTFYAVTVAPPEE